MFRMKLFLAAVLFWTCGAFAGMRVVDQGPCEAVMTQKTLAYTVGDLTRGHLDETLDRTILIRTKSSVPIREFDGLVSHWKKLNLEVTAEIKEFHKEDDDTVIEFTVHGQGREVAKALLEISNPSANLDFGQYPIHSLYVRTQEALPELGREPPVGSELIGMARIPLDRIGFSVRTLNFFRNENLAFVGDIIVRSKKELSRYATAKVIKEIEATLAEKGLRLGTEVPGWPFEDLGIPNKK